MLDLYLVLTHNLYYEYFIIDISVLLCICTQFVLYLRSQNASTIYNKTHDLYLVDKYLSISIDKFTLYEITNIYIISNEYTKIYVRSIKKNQNPQIINHAARDGALALRPERHFWLPAARG